MTKKPKPDVAQIKQKFLCFADLKAIGIPYARETIWRKIKRKEFPKPVKFGGKNSRCFFAKDEILSWRDRS